MAVDEAVIIGRDAELQAISAFLEPKAESRALLIEGDAGIASCRRFLRSGITLSVDQARPRGTTYVFGLAEDGVTSVYVRANGAEVPAFVG